MKDDIELSCKCRTAFLLQDGQIISDFLQLRAFSQAVVVADLYEPCRSGDVVQPSLSICHVARAGVSLASVCLQCAQLVIH